jgi:hypothetical protein
VRLQALASDLRLALRLSAAHPLVKEAMALGGMPAGVSRRPSGIVSSAELAGLQAILAKLKESNLLSAQSVH